MSGSFEERGVRESRVEATPLQTQQFGGERIVPPSGMQGGGVGVHRRSLGERGARVSRSEGRPPDAQQFNGAENQHHSEMQQGGVCVHRRGMAFTGGSGLSQRSACMMVGVWSD